MSPTTEPRDSGSDIRKKSDTPSTASNDSWPPLELEEGESKEIELHLEDAISHARSNPNTTQQVLVKFAPNDPANPWNWPLWKKWYLTILVNVLGLVTAFVAGGYTLASKEIATEFGKSELYGNLGYSVHLWGFAFGTTILAPLSESRGRLPVYLISWLLLVILQIPTALATNMTTILVTKAFQGIVGAAPLANAAGTISDLFPQDSSGPPMMLFVLSHVGGHAIILVPAGWIIECVGWRWLFWIFMITCGVLWVLMLLTMPETRHSKILARHAKQARLHLIKEGFEHAEVVNHIHDAQNRGKKLSVRQMFSAYLFLPFRLLASEPITMAAAAYNALIFGIYFLFNEAFPLVFSGQYGFSTGQQGLSFIGLAVGATIAACFHPLQEKYFNKRKNENGGVGVAEARMYQARFGAFLLPISLMWFAWTAQRSIHWIVPIIASSLFAAGVYIVMTGMLSYIADAYHAYSASALAAVMLLRNIAGGCFPLFAPQMYHELGIPWASMLLGFLTILFIPIPIWWFYRGQSLREKSPWARELTELKRGQNNS